jgi:hypothetical protein
MGGIRELIRNSVVSPELEASSTLATTRNRPFPRVGEDRQCPAGAVGEPGNVLDKFVMCQERGGVFKSES